MQVIRSPSAIFLNKIFVESIANLILRYEEEMLLDFQCLATSMLTHATTPIWLNQRMTIDDLRSVCATSLPTFGMNPARNLRLIISTNEGNTALISKKTPGHYSISEWNLQEGCTIYIMIQLW